MTFKGQLSRIAKQACVATFLAGVLSCVSSTKSVSAQQESEYVRMTKEQRDGARVDSKKSVGIGHGDFLVKKADIPGYPLAQGSEDKVYLIEHRKWPREVFNDFLIPDSILSSEFDAPRGSDAGTLLTRNGLADLASSCERPCASVGAFMINENFVVPKFPWEMYAHEDNRNFIVVDAVRELNRNTKGELVLTNGLKSWSVAYLDGGAVAVNVPAEEYPALSKFGDRVMPLHPGFRIDRNIGPENRELVVSFFEKPVDKEWDTFKKIVAVAGSILGVDAGNWTRAHIRLSSPEPIYELAKLSSVRWIGIEERIEMRARGSSAILQSGNPGIRPLFEHGLFGDGQTIGLIDNAFDIHHCFFSDWTAPGRKHRKVRFFPDAPDSSSGLDLHGTIIAGILAGEDWSVPGDTKNGQAPKARLAFAPLRRFEDTVQETVQVTAIDSQRPGTLEKQLEELWSKGARVFSLSWGNDACEPVPDKGNCKLGRLASDIDRFSSNHEDSLVVVAISNGERITSPENARNALAVGASRQFGFSDKERPDLKHQRFENRYGIGGMGPTFDGRWKPDVYAPGCRIQSAEAGTVCDLADAVADPRSTSAYHEHASSSVDGVKSATAVTENIKGDVGDGIGQGFLANSAAAVETVREEVGRFDSQPSIRTDPPSVGDSLQERRVGLTPTPDDLPSMPDAAIRSGSCATSWAAPAAAGAAALVREYFLKGWYPTGGMPCKAIGGNSCLARPPKGKAHECEPSGALLKAMLVQSAIPMTRLQNEPMAVPGAELGFGRVQLSKVLYFADDKGDAQGEDEKTGTDDPELNGWRTVVIDTRGSGDLDTGEVGGPYEFEISDGELKVTLVWMDPEYSVASPESLGNDLDLVVSRKAPKGKKTEAVFCGNRFSDSPKKPEEKCDLYRDAINNVEQVIVSDQGESKWHVEVVARHVSGPKGERQRYALVISGKIKKFPSGRVPTSGNCSSFVPSSHRVP